jgi:prepilin-type N-terminal cleavage/methylation domain-containing protein
MQRARRSPAFTLVELLVVIAIIGALVALLLPAIQAARESARRTECQNHLRQIGIGIALYANSKGTFPVGCIGPSWTTNRHHSWNTQILPTIEEQTLWEQIDLNLASYHATNKVTGARSVNVFLCPSTVSPLLLSESGAWRGTAFTDYAGVYGVEGQGRDAELELPPGATDPATPRVQQVLKEASLGVFLFDLAIAPKNILDGLSKTACCAETLLRRQGECEWINGQNIFSQEQSTPINGVGLNNEIGSPHPGGASLAFCDARVDFIEESIDQSVLTALLTKAGGE